MWITSMGNHRAVGAISERRHSSFTLALSFMWKSLYTDIWSLYWNMAPESRIIKTEIVPNGWQAITWTKDDSSSRKYTWKCHLQNNNHYVPGYELQQHCIPCLVMWLPWTLVKWWTDAYFNGLVQEWHNSSAFSNGVTSFLHLPIDFIWLLGSCQYQCCLKVTSDRCLLNVFINTPFETFACVSDLCYIIIKNRYIPPSSNVQTCW